MNGLKDVLYYYANLWWLIITWHLQGEVFNLSSKDNDFIASWSLRKIKEHHDPQGLYYKISLKSSIH